jgi:hypothetical protein
LTSDLRQFMTPDIIHFIQSKLHNIYIKYNSYLCQEKSLSYIVVYINVVKNGKAKVSKHSLKLEETSNSRFLIIFIVQIDGRQEYLGIFLTQIEVIIFI